MINDVQRSNVELVVYSVVSPEHGPAYFVYTEEDIEASGGIHAIERILEKKSYWFVRLGVILGEADPHGLTYADTDCSKLAISLPPDAWQIGMRNPGFGRSELDRRVFKAIFGAVNRLLESWKRELEGGVDAYALKELRISSDCLVSLTNGLQNLRQVHEVAHITVMKYWYDPTWPEPPGPDSVVAEFSLVVPFLVQWSAGEEIVDVHVLPFSFC